MISGELGRQLKGKTGCISGTKPEGLLSGAPSIEQAPWNQIESVYKLPDKLAGVLEFVLDKVPNLLVPR